MTNTAGTRFCEISLFLFPFLNVFSSVNLHKKDERAFPGNLHYRRLSLFLPVKCSSLSLLLSHFIFFLSFGKHPPTHKHEIGLCIIQNFGVQSVMLAGELFFLLIYSPLVS